MANYCRRASEPCRAPAWLTASVSPRRGFKKRARLSPPIVPADERRCDRDPDETGGEMAEMEEQSRARRTECTETRGQ